MDNSTSLYTQDAPIHMGKLLQTFRSKKSEKGEVTVSVFDKCIVESNSKGRVYMLFDFDIKFSFLLSPSSITFEKGE